MAFIPPLIAAIASVAGPALSAIGAPLVGLGTGAAELASSIGIPSALASAIGTTAIAEPILGTIGLATGGTKGLEEGLVGGLAPGLGQLAAPLLGGALGGLGGSVAGAAGSTIGTDIGSIAGSILPSLGISAGEKAIFGQPAATPTAQTNLPPPKATPGVSAGAGPSGLGISGSKPPQLYPWVGAPSGGGAPQSQTQTQPLAQAA